MKDIRHKRSHVVCIRHVQRKQGYVTESRLMLPWANVRCEEMAEGHGLSFVSHENTLQLIMVLGAQV